MKLKVTRNACPRNCFGTCSILSYVDGDKLVKVTGDPKHGFTQGHLCAKGYAYTQYVYHPDRLKYPMLQTPRGSGNWKRISWDEAYHIIAKKMIELNHRYESNLACGYSKFSGNLDLLHLAVEGMFNSIGPHTKGFGNVCLSTGEQATRESFGELISPVPEDMVNSKCIVIWGANPAVTNIHQMKFIYRARKQGGKLIVIDPLYTETAAKADLYVQIKPGSDTLLALAIAKLLLMEGTMDESFAKKQNGWTEFSHLLEQIDFSKVTEATGVSFEVMKELATVYGTVKPIATWNGIGIQRNQYGGQSIRAINSLAALSGNLHLKHGGVYFTHGDTNDFPLSLLNFPEKKHPFISGSRFINNSNFATEALDLKEPPLKLLWIAARSPFSQDHHIKAWQELFKGLELIVTVDLFMTETAEQSDLVLPAASHFEEEDLNVGYWHHWLSINEKTIPPYFEAKSDLKIVRELTKKLNELVPNFSTFPHELEPIDWIEKEISEEIKTMYGIRSYEDLLEGPRQRVKLEKGKRSNIFSFIHPNDVSALLDPDLNSEENRPYPYRILSPQSLLKIHSQFSSLPWLHPEEEETIVELNEKVARDKDIHHNSMVKIFNENGAVIAKAKTNLHLPVDVILVRQTKENSINQLIGIHMEKENEAISTNFYDSFVDIVKHS